MPTRISAAIPCMALNTARFGCGVERRPRGAAPARSVQDDHDRHVLRAVVRARHVQKAVPRSVQPERNPFAEHTSRDRFGEPW